MDMEKVYSQRIRKVRLRLLRAGAQVPAYASLQAAGADLSACLPAPLLLEPGSQALVPTGLSFEIPEGFEIQVRSRSGLASREGLFVLNSPGTIDSDYRGEVQVILANLGAKAVCIQPGQRIAQAILAPVFQAEFELCTELTETARGTGGFGSTGH